MNKKILVIVAHPDDETIWIGGTLLKNKNNWQITIISLCRRDDNDRKPKFEKACKILNAKCFISDLDDSETETFKEIPTQDIISRINKFIDDKNKDYDYIFTHGKNGEYGHIRHIEIHKAVGEMLNKKLLSAKKVFFFSYQKKNDVCSVNKSADKFIRLTDNQFNKKKQLIQEVYGFEENSFENKCCMDIESFDTR